MAHRGNKSYKCSRCDKVFSVTSRLVAHMMTHSGMKLHRCSLCDKVFSMKVSLVKHMATHRGEKVSKNSMNGNESSDSVSENQDKSPPAILKNGLRPFNCIRCGNSFLSKQNLDKHMKSHRGAKLKCYICGIVLRRMENLQRHVMVHTGERPHKCPQCDKAFILRKELNHHMMKHPAERPHKCTLCDMAFPVESSLARHMLAHKGARPHRCPLCRDRFRTRGTLKEHMMSSHRQKKPHKCSLCFKRFRHEQTLEKHMWNHSREKPNIYFDRPMRLRRMVTKKYVMSDPEEESYVSYKCSQCSKRFDQLEALEDHMMTHTEAHSRNMSLNEDIEALSDDDLYTDKRPHKCWHCEAGFPYQHDLFKHITAHICFICHDIFCQLEYLDEHMKTHVEAESTKCLRCGADFPNKCDLHKHLKTHSDKDRAQGVLKIKMSETGERSYKCSGCEKAFGDLLTACSHILTHKISQNEQSLNFGDEEVTYQRTVYELDKETDVKDDIVSQIYSKYSDCATCMRGFVTPAELENHLVAHRYMEDMALCQDYS